MRKRKKQGREKEKRRTKGRRTLMWVVEKRQRRRGWKGWVEDAGQEGKGGRTCEAEEMPDRERESGGCKYILYRV